MPSANREMIGICGLYCGDCPFYLASRIGDDEQLESLSRATGLAKKDIVCDGCLSDRVAPECRVCKHGFRACAGEHGVTWCSECGDFPCERLQDFSRQHVVNGICHHEGVIKDLAYLRDNGPESWLALQENRSQCPSCGDKWYWFSRECKSCRTKIR